MTTFVVHRNASAIDSHTIDSMSIVGRALFFKNGIDSENYSVLITAAQERNVTSFVYS